MSIRDSFLDTHERIIDDDVFEKVQEIRNQRHRMTRTGKSSIFSGMVYCADCGSKMQYGSSNNRDFRQDFFDCSLHKKNGSKCKRHFIRLKVLEEMCIRDRLYSEQNVKSKPGHAAQAHGQDGIPLELP